MKGIVKWLAPLSLVGFVLSVPVGAMAVYVGPWDSPAASGTLSPVSPAGSDIVDAYHAYDAGAHYFQINLAGSTNTLIGSTTNFGLIGSYRIYVDLTPGSGTAYDFAMGYNLSYNKNTTNYAWALVSENLTGALTGNAPVGSGPAFNSTFLQWAYADPPSGTGHIGQYFTWWAETGNKAGILDTTGTATATPIPNAAWLLGSGIIGLIGLQRRRARKAK